FYIGINIGALLATTVVAYVGETYGFDKGFALAGFGMLTGILIFWAGRQKYSAAPGLEFTEAGKQKVVGPLNRIQLVSIASLGLIPACYFLILNNSLLNYIFLGLFVYVAYVLLSAGIKEDKAEGTSIWKDRMIALLLFMVINIVFWACFEQAGTSLTLFADRNVDRAIFGWEMPASMTQFFNPAFIIIFGSIFSVMWIKLSKIGKNPSIPMKFALGIFQLGLGFLVTYVGFTMETDNMVPLLTLVILYMLHTTGELFLSPIGLSMVTKLSPKKIAGTAMGAWFLSFAIANFLGGRIAALTGGGHGGGPESDGTTFSAETTVKDAFGMMGAPEDFEAWPALAEGISQDDDVAKNTNYQNWSDIRDWVLLRESLTEQVSLEAWVGARTAQKEFTSADSWLDRATWDDLSGRYTAIVTDDNAKKEDDDEATEAGLGFKDWLYFRNGIENLEVEASSPLAAALDVQIDTVQETRLNKYVHIFSIIGIVLVGISILIALISKPLQKLMHGVE
ncbi:MAG: oligopeptide:H+ symporter, partial [Bacteroidota bacterium]